MNEILKLSEYREWIGDLKQQIQRSQIKAALSVNSQLIMLYWDLGRQIVEKQENSKWGSGFIEQLSKDLRAAFPDLGGFSKTNLFRIRNFYLFYHNRLNSFEKFPQLVGKISDYEKATQSMRQTQDATQLIPQLAGILQNEVNQQITTYQQVVNQIIQVPWGHHITIIEKLNSIDVALFYIHKTIENNWSRSVLEYQIESKLYERQGKAITNFTATLPAPQSDLANALLKDPYNFGFLQLSEKIKETDLEKALVNHISQFLPELGIGFAYLGRQFLLKVGKKEYRTDLLFYHTRLKCYVVIELKTKEFEPEFVGKLNFYINAINEFVRDNSDRQTIGMLLVKNKDNYEVEFALKDVNNPIGVSAFRYTELTDEIKAALPSEEELTQELINFEKNLMRK
ncbi:MAG: PDDEXK nuclease domain-containing protein [Dysgonamonadaceae bacterium]|jgi:predicted nuclease of restriction endonuclease-like (RecB) superfamily|nr:PDDEXK nuclease domain-containing protein [Dysgonamonadaceae bacterium]